MANQSEHTPGELLDAMLDAKDSGDSSAVEVYKRNLRELGVYVAFCDESDFVTETVVVEADRVRISAGNVEIIDGGMGDFKILVDGSEMPVDGLTRYRLERAGFDELAALSTTIIVDPRIER